MNPLRGVESSPTISALLPSAPNPLHGVERGQVVEMVRFKDLNPLHGVGRYVRLGVVFNGIGLL